jgi:hypothetical protein
VNGSTHLSTRQYARTVNRWVVIGFELSAFTERACAY